MSLDLKPVQVRLCKEAYDALKMLADANDHDLGEELAKVATEALLGKSHCIKVLARRLAGAVKSDNLR